MSRKFSYWNNIPLTIVGGSESRKVLRAWGIIPWGSSRPRKFSREFGGEVDYVGWQRVHLPEGWMISLEGHDFFLLDDYGRVRGEIHRAFEHVKHPGSFSEAIGEAITEALKDSEETKKRTALPPGPYLELRRAISVRSSFSLGEKGPYSYYVTDPFGREIFGMHDVEISQEEYAKKMPELTGKVDTWLEEHYPRWKSHYFYWDKFV